MKGFLERISFTFKGSNEDSEVWEHINGSTITYHTNTNKFSYRIRTGPYQTSFEQSKQPIGYMSLRVLMRTSPCVRGYKMSQAFYIQRELEGAPSFAPPNPEPIEDDEPWDDDENDLTSERIIGFTERELVLLRVAVNKRLIAIEEELLYDSQSIEKQEYLNELQLLNSKIQ